MNTRAQRWSGCAFTLVSAVAKKPAEAKYKTSCMKMPSLIHQCGLLQALVFQVARDDEGVRYVNNLAHAYFNDQLADHKKLIQFAQEQEVRDYMALTHDVGEIAHWFRRFAQIELANADEAGHAP